MTGIKRGSGDLDLLAQPPPGSLASPRGAELGANRPGLIASHTILSHA